MWQLEIRNTEQLNIPLKFNQNAVKELLVVTDTFKFHDEKTVLVFLICLLSFWNLQAMQYQAAF